MGIQHYEPELSQMVKEAQGAAGDPPLVQGIIYDIEPWQKFRNEFVDGEEVVITEKIHGTNARFTFQNSINSEDIIPTNRMFCGSHNFWRKEGDNLYWNILKHIPWVEAFCRLNPGVILYGEIFGAVQKGFNYGSTQDNPYQFRAFDLYANGRFLDYDDALGGAQSDFLVPVLYRGPYSHEVVQKYSSGMSVIEGANHIREGVVIKPVKERFSERMRDRLILKFVSMDYLEGKKK
jgi:RNA ligase (TIGR02306 family)